MQKHFQSIGSFYSEEFRRKQARKTHSENEKETCLLRMAAEKWQTRLMVKPGMATEASACQRNVSPAAIATLLRRF